MVRLRELVVDDWECLELLKDLAFTPKVPTRGFDGTWEILCSFCEETMKRDFWRRDSFKIVRLALKTQ